MNHELLTPEIVAELQQGIKSVVEASEEEEGGQAQLDAVEQGLRRMLNRMGTQLMKQYLHTEGRECERGPKRCEQCGGGLRNVKRAALTVQSIFGPVAIRRAHYHCRACARSVYPLDERYGWQAHRYTPTAKEWVCLLCQAQPYEEAVEILGRVSGMRGTVESFREVVQECGQQMTETRDAVVELINKTEAPLPQVAAPSRLMVVGADGCCVLKSGVKVGRRKKGQKRPKKAHRSRRGVRRCSTEAKRERGMEVKVGMVGALIRNAQNEYKIEQKSYVTTFERVDVFEDLLLVESLQRGVPQAEQVLVMGDGAAWIWKRIASLVPQEKRVEIVDWFHLKDKVWETAEVLYGSREHWATRNWAEQKLDQLWNGDVLSVVRALHQLECQRKQKGKRQQRALDAIHTLTHYLTENQTRMDYPRYRRRGWPIATGDVESACKNVVGARMKRSGMQWRKKSAAPLLHVRAEFLSRRWDKNWKQLRAAA
jgi:hypothetical protein